MANPAEQRPDSVADSPSIVTQSDNDLTPRMPAQGEATPARSAVPGSAPTLAGANRPSRSLILLAGLTTAVVVVGLAWWSHDHTATVAAQEVPPAAGVATVRITVPGTEDGSADAGSGADAPVSKPTHRTTTAPTSRPSASPTPLKVLVNTAGNNLALNRPAWASSSEGPGWAPSNAFDGNAESRWSSGFSDPQWIAVDLGARWEISEVRLNWENAYATAYRVVVSNDRKTWKSVYSTDTSQGGNVTVEVKQVPGRFVRVYCTKRSSQYGNSLFEVDVR